MSWDARTLHRNIAYFYLGLIISFSFSGIFLNHRKDWFPKDYVYESKEISVTMPDSIDGITQGFIDGIASSLSIDDQYKGYRVRDNSLRISYDNTTVDLDIVSGKGNMEQFFQVPLLAQMTDLHITTNKWWIYYSDLFGIGMLVIAITGMFIQKGSLGFKQSGWKLSAIGIIFPLIFLFLLS